MDNFGYKEPPSTVPKAMRQSRFRRTVNNPVMRSTEVEAEEVPLSDSRNKFSTMNNVRWCETKQDVFEEEIPSDTYEYMVVGPCPPAESAPNMYDSYDDSSPELNVEISPEIIRQTLVEQFRQNSTQSFMFEDIESSNVSPENVYVYFEKATPIEKNLCFLWAAYHKRKDLLAELLRAGADLHFHDTNGMSALHISSFMGCLACTRFLIWKGAHVNEVNKCFSPLHYSAFGNKPDVAKLLIEHGACVTMATKRTNYEETILHCAVRANAVDCLQVLIDQPVDVNSIEPSGVNPVHLAADLGMTKCLEILLNSKDTDVNARTRVRDKEYTALHLAADEGNEDCINLLLARGADVNLKNHRGFTALHLAARCSTVECVESLLMVGNANPNAEDFDKRTPLHAAIGKLDSAVDIIEILVKKGAKINQKDEYGFTPLHLAALDGLAHCVEALIKHGADVTTKSKKGNSALNVITRKTPVSISMIFQKLDDAITLHVCHDRSNREVELEFDFRSILQHCHPKEISYLNTFVDEGQKEILLHPLCSAFLHIKWEKIRKYYIAKLLFYLVFVLFLTLYVFTALAKNCVITNKVIKPEDEPDKEVCQTESIFGKLLRDNPFGSKEQWCMLLVITVIEIICKLYGLTGYKNMRQYLTQLDNVLEWFVIVCVFLTSCIYPGTTFTWKPWQHHIGAFAVLAGWTNLMLMIGQLPVFGLYVTMYQKVQLEFLKLIMAYFCILIGFTVSFCVIFPNSATFSNPFMAFITVLTMMVGELNLDLLSTEEEKPASENQPVLLEISAQITYVLFLMFVTVVLMNLLVGIAVHDIQGLKKTASLSKLVRQTKLISYMEAALFNAHLPNFFVKCLHKSALVSPKAYRVVLSVKPLNPMEKRLPRDVMMAAYNMAKERKKYGKKLSSKPTFRRFDNNNDYEASEYSWTIRSHKDSQSIETLVNDLREMKNTVKLQQAMLQTLMTLMAKNNQIENSSSC